MGKSACVNNYFQGNGSFSYFLHLSGPFSCFLHLSFSWLIVRRCMVALQYQVVCQAKLLMTSLICWFGSGLAFHWCIQEPVVCQAKRQKMWSIDWETFRNVVWRQSEWDTCPLDSNICLGHSLQHSLQIIAQDYTISLIYTCQIHRLNL